MKRLAFYLKPLVVVVALVMTTGAFAQSNPGRINKLIEMFENDQPAFGVLSFDYSLNNARSMANSGLDFLFIDMEHAAVRYQTARAPCR